MATPAGVRLAIGASVLMTGGATYYFLSDGGDPHKLEENLSQTSAQLSETSTKIVEAGAQLKNSVVSWSQSLALSKDNVQEGDVEGHSTERDITQLQTDAEQPPAHSGYREPYCHTCSGPRIWFFAEKLRLKRRLTPYPDPPRD